MTKLEMHSITSESLTGAPEELSRQIPLGSEMVVTEQGKPVAVLASVEIDRARAILASIRRLRDVRGKIELDPLDCMEISDLPGREQGTWMVFDDHCRQILGRGSCFEEARVLARREGLADPVIMGTPRFDHREETEILFVSLGSRC